MTKRATLRIAQVAEAVFAVLALLFALSLPWQPNGSMLLAWSFWIILTVVGFWLAWRLGRPTRTTWILAAVLSGATILLAIRSRIVIVDPPPGVSASAAAVSERLAMFWWFTQVVVAICLWRLRHLVMPGRTLHREDAV